MFVFLNKPMVYSDLYDLTLFFSYAIYPLHPEAGMCYNKALLQRQKADVKPNLSAGKRLTLP